MVSQVGGCDDVGVFGSSSSAFWFYGKLSPAINVPPFFAQEIPICEGARIEIIFEHLGIWAGPGVHECKQPEEVTQLGRLVVGMWALIAGQALTWSLDGWVEATEAEFAGSVMGYRPHHYRDPATAQEDSRDSRRIRKAAEIAIELRQMTQYRLALRDIHTAVSDDSDDAIFFAYRAIENAARAIAGVDGELGRAGWEAFHVALGRSAAEGKALMEPLTKARDAVGHGDVNPTSPPHRDQRKELIMLGRSLVAEALGADPNVDVQAGAIDVLEPQPSLPADRPES